MKKKKILNRFAAAFLITVLVFSLSMTSVLAATTTYIDIGADIKDRNTGGNTLGDVPTAHFISDTGKDTANGYVRLQPTLTSGTTCAISNTVPGATEDALVFSLTKQNTGNCKLRASTSTPNLNLYDDIFAADKAVVLEGRVQIEDSNNPNSIATPQFNFVLGYAQPSAIANKPTNSLATGASWAYNSNSVSFGGAYPLTNGKTGWHTIKMIIDKSCVDKTNRLVGFKYQCDGGNINIVNNGNKASSYQPGYLGDTDELASAVNLTTVAFDPKTYGANGGAAYPSAVNFDIDYEKLYIIDGPHSITSTSIANDATVPVTTSSFDINFSQDLDSTTINSTNITVAQSGGETPAYTVSQTGKTATVNFTDGIQAGKTYTVNVGTGVRDIAQRALTSSQYTFSVEKNISFTSVTLNGDTAMTSGTNVPVQAIVKNNIATENVCVIFALYKTVNSVATLENCIIDSHDAIGGTTTTFGGTFDNIPANAGGTTYKVKAFLWNGIDTMVPYDLVNYQ